MVFSSIILPAHRKGRRNSYLKFMNAKKPCGFWHAKKVSFSCIGKLFKLERYEKT